MLEKKTFIGGLDSDTEERLIEPGDYRDSLNNNTGINESGDLGLSVKEKGNKLIDYALPTGTNETIYSFDDKEGRRVIYFEYNSAGSHAILQYFYDTDSIVLIVKDSSLGFSPSSPITHANVVNGTLLYFTDDNNEPGLIDIDYAIAGSYPNNFKRQYVDAIPYAPLCPPTYSYSSDDTVNSNSLKGRLFQFKYAWVYPDGRKSAFSPISKVNSPSGEEFNSTGDLFQIWENNVIDLIVTSGDEYATKIEIIAREGNFGDFFSVVTLDKEQLSIPDNSNHTYKFYNNETPLAIDKKEADSLQSFIPRKAATQEFIEGNRMLWMNVLTDYDISDTLTDMIDKGTKAEPVYIFPQTVGNPSITINQAVILPPNPATFTIGALVGANDIYVITIDHNWGTGNAKVTFVIKAVAGDTSDIIAENFKDDINIWQNKLENENTITAGQKLTATRTGSVVDITSLGLPTTAQLSDANANSIATTVNSFKAGARHPLGVMYQDEKGRISTVLTSDAMTMDVEWFTEPSHLKGNTEAKISVFHQPPVWATKYHVMYARNQTYNIGEGGKYQFLQFIIKTATASGPTKYQLGLQSILDYATANQNSVLSYGFAKGDRLRLIEDGNGDAYDIMKDLEILAYDEGTNEVTVEASGVLVNPNMLVELYTPKQEVKEKLWFEIGECFDIGDIGLDTRYHKGNTQDQNFKKDNTIVGDVSVSQSPLMPPQFDGNVRFIWDNLTYPLFNQEVVAGDTLTFASGPYAGTHTILYVAPIINGFGSVVINITYTQSLINQSAIITTSPNDPAILRINEGDVYFKSRAMTDSGGNLKTKLVEEHHYSDFYVSNYNNIGRPNVVDDSFGETRRPTIAYYTEPFVPDTNINGLGTVFDDSFEEYDKSYGGAIRLYSEDKKLICFQEQKVGQILISETYYSDLEGGKTVGASTTILGPMIYYAGEYGIDLASDSFDFFGNRKYFIDAKRAAVVRLSQDGHTPISEKKMHSFFSDLFNKHNASAITRKILGAYDRTRERYLLSIQYEAEYPGTKAQEDSGSSGESAFEGDPGSPGGGNEIPTPTQGKLCLDDANDFENINISSDGKIVVTWTGINGSKESVEAILIAVDLDNKCLYIDYEEFVKIRTGPVNFVGLEQKTIAFSESKNRWVDRYSYAPESMCSAGLGVVSFKEGKLYKHNANDLRANYYGTQYESEIQFPVNEEPSKVKFFSAISIESNQDGWYMKEAVNQQGQKTSLLKEDFQRIESHLYSDILRDENTPVENPIIEGDTMRSHSMLVTLANDNTGEVKLLMAGVKYGASELSNQ